MSEQVPFKFKCVACTKLIALTYFKRVQLIYNVCPILLVQRIDIVL